MRGGGVERLPGGLVMASAGVLPSPVGVIGLPGLVRVSPCAGVRSRGEGARCAGVRVGYRWRVPGQAAIEVCPVPGLARRQASVRGQGDGVGVEGRVQVIGLPSVRWVSGDRG